MDRPRLTDLENAMGALDRALHGLDTLDLYANKLHSAVLRDLTHQIQSDAGRARAYINAEWYARRAPATREEAEE